MNQKFGKNYWKSYEMKKWMIKVMNFIENRGENGEKAAGERI